MDRPLIVVDRLLLERRPVETVLDRGRRLSLFAPARRVNSPACGSITDKRKAPLLVERGGPSNRRAGINPPVAGKRSCPGVESIVGGSHLSFLPIVIGVT
jgi:hypothetical protein